MEYNKYTKVTATLMFSLALESYIPIFVKNNVSDIVEKDSGIAIKVKYSAHRDVFLNETAKEILHLTNGKINVSEIISELCKTYPNAGEKLISDDVLETLEVLWRLTLITWKGNNPFSDINLVQKTIDGSIFLATHDNKANVRKALKNKIHTSPSLQDGALSIDSVLYNIVTGVMDCVLYEKEGKVNFMVLFIKQNKVRDILTICGQDICVNTLVEVLDEFEKRDCFEVITASCIEDDIKTENLFDHLGFKCAGVLKNEVPAGDVKVFFRSRRN